MKLLALFLGFSLSFICCLGQSVVVLIANLLLSFVIAAWAVRRRLLPWFAIPFGVSLLFALSLRFLPYGSGGTVVGYVSKAGENYFVLSTWFRRYYVSSRGHPYQLGDIVEAQGEFTPLRFTEYESRFSFASYLQGIGVKAEISKAKIEPKMLFFWRIRQSQNDFLSHFSARGKALLQVLLFGQRDYQSDLIVLADGLSILSLLSSMGLFYSFLLGKVESLLTKFIPKYADLITLAIALLPLPFSLTRMGVMRIFFMRAIKAIDVHGAKWNLGYLDRLSLAGMILLLNPYNALNTGFLASFGIALTLYVHRHWINVRNRLLSKVLVMGFIQLFLLPFAWSAGSVHVFTFLFALLFYPVTLVLMGLGWLSFLTIPFSGLFNGVGDMLYAVFSALQSVDVVLPLPPLSLLGIILFYLVFFLSLYLTQVGARGFRNGLIIASVGLYCCSLIPLVPALSQSVAFINVGQGDCALIQDGMTTVMIDTGGVKNIDMAEECLIPYLRKRRIYHLDAIIASHQDYDHVGAVSSLRKLFTVRRYVTEPSAFPLTLGNLTFVNHNVFSASEENDKSLVLSLDFMKRKWLFTGDAPVWIEKKIIQTYPDLDIDVLKVGHHGSDTSTCDEFLDAITPSLAVISCGINNKYGHPTPIVISRLKKRGIEIRRTDEEGTIEIARPKFL